MPELDSVLQLLNLTQEIQSNFLSLNTLFFQFSIKNKKRKYLVTLTSILVFNTSFLYSLLPTWGVSLTVWIQNSGHSIKFPRTRWCRITRIELIEMGVRFHYTWTLFLIVIIFYEYYVRRDLVDYIARTWRERQYKFNNMILEKSLTTFAFTCKTIELFLTIFVPTSWSLQYLLPYHGAWLRQP